MPGQHLVLVGLMGAGKTTVGHRCAELLCRPFVDTDELVVAAAGVPFADLWAAEGESGFRARERVAVVDAAASPEPLVIACGGGAVLDPDNRQVLRSAGFVVCLWAPVKVLASRVGGGDDRPLLRGDAEAALDRLLAVRTPSYLDAAHKTVDTEDKSVDEVARAVVRMFERWNG